MQTSVYNAQTFWTKKKKKKTETREEWILSRLQYMVVIAVHFYHIFVRFMLRLKLGCPFIVY